MALLLYHTEFLDAPLLTPQREHLLEVIHGGECRGILILAPSSLRVVLHVGCSGARVAICSVEGLSIAAPFCLLGVDCKPILGSLFTR